MPTLTVKRSDIYDGAEIIVDERLVGKILKEDELTFVASTNGLIPSIDGLEGVSVEEIYAEIQGLLAEGALLIRRNAILS